MPNPPRKYKRKGITTIELARMFPDEESARLWFENVMWPDGRTGVSTLRLYEHLRSVSQDHALLV